MFLLRTQERDEAKHISTLLKHKQLAIKEAFLGVSA